MPPKELPKAEGEEQKPKKRSRFKIIMIVGSILLLLGAGGGAGYWWLFMRPDATGFAGLFSSSGDAEKAPAEATASETASSAKGTTPAPASTTRSVLKPVALPSLTVNLADSPGNRYLKIGMEVEVNAQDAVQELQSQNARVRDAIILLLSSKTVAQLTSAEGKVLLKNEVVARLNQILGAPRVVRIYFTDFVIQ